jgi:hypothetical protein
MTGMRSWTGEVAAWFLSFDEPSKILLIMKIPVETARPSKFTNAQTILYEIDMVRFAAGSLGEAKDWSSWRNLECFLLHFRNLIEFFGKPQPRPTDLSIQWPERIWPDAATMPSAEALKRLHREDLWEKYELVEDRISRYLHHCTEQRVEGKNWKVREMFEGLNPLMSEFESLQPDKNRPWGNLPNLDRILAATIQDACSTATVNTVALMRGFGPPSANKASQVEEDLPK